MSKATEAMRRVDECGPYRERPEIRFVRVREWIAAKIASK